MSAFFRARLSFGRTPCRGRPASAVSGFAAYGGGVPFAGARRPVSPEPPCYPWTIPSGPVLLPAGHPMGPPPEPSEAVPVGRGRRNGAERSPRRQAGTEWAEFLLTMWGLTPWSGHSSEIALLSIEHPVGEGLYPFPPSRAHPFSNRTPDGAGLCVRLFSPDAGLRKDRKLIPAAPYSRWA